MMKQMKRMIFSAAMISMAAHAMQRDVAFALTPTQLKINETYTIRGIMYAHTGHVLPGTKYERFLFADVASLLPGSKKHVVRQLLYDYSRKKWFEFDFTPAHDGDGDGAIKK